MGIATSGSYMKLIYLIPSTSWGSYGVSPPPLILYVTASISLAQSGLDVIGVK
jgi:hypothetical protein